MDINCIVLANRLPPACTIAIKLGQVCFLSACLVKLRILAYLAQQQKLTGTRSKVFSGQASSENKH